MGDWIDDAVARIVAQWPAWQAVAGQLAQNEQNPEAGQEHLRECVANVLRWHEAQAEIDPIAATMPTYTDTRPTTAGER